MLLFQNELRSASAPHRRHGVPESRQPHVPHHARGFEACVRAVRGGGRYLHPPRQILEREPRIRFCKVSERSGAHQNSLGMHYSQCLCRPISSSPALKPWWICCVSHSWKLHFYQPCKGVNFVTVKLFLRWLLYA